MDRLKNSGVLAAIVLSACSTNISQPLSSAAAQCNSGAQYVEVSASGVVTQYLGVHSSESGMHEGFYFRSGGQNIRVEDNTDITGPIPLRTGDRIALLGQYECNDGVIHWTHHDPRFRHIAGYIEVNGRRYQ